MSSIKTVFIVGPTAAGKTTLSVELAKRFDGEIVSADSMQIYNGIHIASAAVDEDEKCGIEHHLIEFLELDEQFSVADYVKIAREKIKEIKGRGKLPIVVGGTGLYINSLAENLVFFEEETSEALRQSLEEEFDRLGGEKMLLKLKEFDEETANRLHPNNRRRIIRAFEVFKLSGKTITEQNITSHRGEAFIDPIIIGITYNDREKLYDRINRRVDIMLENGLLDEARITYKNANSKGAFQAIGHKELYGYFDGKITLSDAAEHLKQQTRRYAKRQLTWFRRDDSIKWIFADLSQNAADDAAKLVEEFLKE